MVHIRIFPVYVWTNDACGLVMNRFNDLGAAEIERVAWTQPGKRPSRPPRIYAKAFRKNWIFVGVETRAEAPARVMTPIEMNGVDPQACLAGILIRIHDNRINRLDALLPWNWVPPAALWAAAA